MLKTANRITAVLLALCLTAETVSAAALGGFGGVHKTAALALFSQQALQVPILGADHPAANVEEAARMRVEEAESKGLERSPEQPGIQSLKRPDLPMDSTLDVIARPYRDAYPVLYWLYTIAGASLWETLAFQQHAGTQEGTLWATVGFALAHTLFEWLDRFKSVFAFEDQKSHKKAFWIVFNLTHLKRDGWDFVKRFGLSTVFIAPFLAYAPHAFWISAGLHALYNGVALSFSWKTLASIFQPNRRPIQDLWKTNEGLRRYMDALQENVPDFEASIRTLREFNVSQGISFQGLLRAVGYFTQYPSGEVRSPENVFGLFLQAEALEQALLRLAASHSLRAMAPPEAELAMLLNNASRIYRAQAGQLNTAARTGVVFPLIPMDMDLEEPTEVFHGGDYAGVGPGQFIVTDRWRTATRLMTIDGNPPGTVLILHEPASGLTLLANLTGYQVRDPATYALLAAAFKSEEFDYDGLSPLTAYLSRQDKIPSDIVSLVETNLRKNLGGRRGPILAFNHSSRQEASVVLFDCSLGLAIGIAPEELNQAGDHASQIYEQLRRQSLQPVPAGQLLIQLPSPHVRAPDKTISEPAAARDLSSGA